MSKKFKLIASALNPKFNGFANSKEIKEAKKIARGKFWKLTDFEQFCAYSLSGRRYFFEYEWFSWGTKIQKNRWMRESRRVCRLWCKNKYKDAMKIYNSSYKNCHI